MPGGTQQHPQQRCVTVVASMSTSTSSISFSPQMCALNSSQLSLPSLFESIGSKAVQEGLNPASPTKSLMRWPSASSLSFSLFASSSLLTAPSSSAVKLSKHSFNQVSACLPAATSVATSFLNSSASCSTSCTTVSLTSFATPSATATVVNCMNSSQDTNSPSCRVTLFTKSMISFIPASFSNASKLRSFSSEAASSALFAWPPM